MGHVGFAGNVEKRLRKFMSRKKLMAERDFDEKAAKVIAGKGRLQKLNRKKTAAAAQLGRKRHYL